MKKDAALAALNALEAAAMPGSAALSYLSGVETWTIMLDTTHVYTGAQIAAVADYALANNLTLSAQFTAFGLV